jgi:hypothetical protein
VLPEGVESPHRFDRQLYTLLESVLLFLPCEAALSNQLVGDRSPLVLEAGGACLSAKQPQYRGDQHAEADGSGRHALA